MHGVIRHGVYGVGSAALYLGLSRVSVEWSGDLRPIPLWIATAVCIAIGLVGGRDIWPAVFVGAGIVGNVGSGLLVFDETFRSLLVPAVSVAVEFLVALVLLDRELRQGRRLRRTRQAMRLVGLFAVISIVGATIASIDTSSAVIEDRFEAWEQWALGEFVGLLVIIPLVLAPPSPWVIKMDVRHAIEGLLQSAAVIGLTVLSFNLERPVLYLVVAEIAWVSIRFGLRLSAPLALVVVVVSTWMSGQGSGPFAVGGDPVVQVQLFNSAVAFCAFVLAVHAARGWDDQRQLKAAFRALPDAAVTRSTDGQLVSAWVPKELRPFESQLVHHTPLSPPGRPVVTASSASVAPSQLINVGEHTFEHRIAPIDADNELHLFRDITAITQARQEVKLARERLHLIESEERQRLARALHDGPIQELSAVKLRLGLEESDLPATLNEQRRVTHRLLSSSIAALRDTASSLQPPVAGGRGLMIELQEVASRLFEGTGLILDVSDRLRRSLDAEQSSTLFLVGREAIANVAFHSKSSVAVVALEEVDGAVQLQISDDGVGMDETTPTSGPHFGVAIMYERMRDAGGSLSITPSPGGGTVVTARFDLHRPQVGIGSLGQVS